MSQMALVECLQVLNEVRTERHIVLPTMGSAREWMKLGSDPLDFIYAPSAMGQAPTVGLGLALAQPERQVWVLNGDGCMLMNLGCLVTITAAGATNLVLFVLDNGVYEVTGQQATAAAPRARPQGSPIDYAEIARGCGYRSVYVFDEIDRWRNEVRSVLEATGPTFVVLKVAPVPGGEVPKSPAPAFGRATALRERLISQRVEA